ncbi:MAG: hypothetical protein V3R28_00560, partial [Desulfatiglandales bacterium]
MPRLHSWMIFSLSCITYHDKQYDQPSIQQVGMNVIESLNDKIKIRMLVLKRGRFVNSREDEHRRLLWI